MDLNGPRKAIPLGKYLPFILRPSTNLKLSTFFFFALTLTLGWANSCNYPKTLLLGTQTHRPSLSTHTHIFTTPNPQRSSQIQEFVRTKNAFKEQCSGFQLKSNNQRLKNFAMAPEWARKHRLLEGFYWFHTDLIKQSPGKGVLSLCRLNKDFDSFKALGPLHTEGTVKGAVFYLNERASTVPQSQPKPRVTCVWQPPCCSISYISKACDKKLFFAVSCLLFILTCLWGYVLVVLTKPFLWNMKLTLKVWT